MRRSYFTRLLPAIAVSLFLVSGCASTLTFLGPLKSKLVDGEHSCGNQAPDKYEFIAQGTRIKIIRTPMCEEYVEKLRVAAKQRRGFYLGVLEIPFFGLGLIDILRSYAIVEESKKVVPLAKYPTGRLMPAGPPVPAAGDSFLIEDRVYDLKLTLKSDENGMIDLFPYIPPGAKFLVLTITPVSDPSQSAKVIITR